ncbi:MAG: HEAT repeat domain-containing protein [Campylobacterota bacterium]|nr:HEAT repeat domain-containing protein [Campylobacterota bacterium]
MKIDKKIKEIDNIENKIKSFKNKLINYTNDKDYSTRSKAIEVLSLFYDANIDNVILNGLEDKDSLVRVSALEAIMLPQNIDNVLNKIAKRLNDKSWLVRAYAIEALADNNAKKYHPKIKKLMKKNKNNEVLVRIYYALVKFGEKKYFKKLIKMLRHKNYRVRCATSSMLYYLANKNNYNLIIKSLNKALKKEKTNAAKSCLDGTIKDLIYLKDKGNL